MGSRRLLRRREFDALKKFADDLKPVCSPDQRDLCDEDQLAEIEKFDAMDDDTLKALIKEKEASIAEAESTFKDEVSKLQAAYEKLMAEKDDTIAAVKKSGMGMAKTVLASHNKKE